MGYHTNGTMHPDAFPIQAKNLSMIMISHTSC